MSEKRPHRRYNPLNDSWVLVSPHRTSRPWQGQHEETEAAVPSYVEDCYLCPGNQRAQGDRNPDYDSVYVFDNDYPALLPEAETHINNEGLFRQESVAGTCRVVCYSPDHSLTMASMEVPSIRAVVDCWCEQHDELAQKFQWVQIFENRGQAMGCSNPHPHGQIWACDSLPTEGRQELDSQARYREQHGTTLLGDYADREVDAGERVLLADDYWLVVVPWWAVWPFETLIIAREPAQRLGDLSADARDSLAATMKSLFSGYDKLFSTPFPYSMGWHNAPGTGDNPSWRLHAHVYPPLLRSASVRKFMVGFELLSEPQRDLTPEQACERLRPHVSQVS